MMDSGSYCERGCRGYTCRTGYEAPCPAIRLRDRGEQVDFGDLGLLPSAMMRQLREIPEIEQTPSGRVIRCLYCTYKQTHFGTEPVWRVHYCARGDETVFVEWRLT